MKIPVIIQFLFLLFFISNTLHSQHITSVQFNPQQIDPDGFAQVIITSDIPYENCTTEYIHVFAACGAISIEMYYGAWIFPDDCSRTDTLTIGPFCEGLTFFNVDMYFPDFVKTDFFDTIISIEPATRIQSNIDADKHRFYPNPATDFVFYSFDAQSADNAICIIQDLSGKTVLKKNISIHDQMHPIALQGLSKGVYVLNMHFNKGPKQSGLLIKN